MTEPEKPANNRGETRDDEHEETRHDSREDTDQSDQQEPPEDSAENRASAPADGQVSRDDRVRSGRAGPLAWLAMLVALAALALASYPFWSHWLMPGSAEQTGPSTSDFEQLSDRVESIGRESLTGIEALRQTLDQLSSEFETDAQGPDADVLVDRIEQLSDRIDQLSTRLERLQGERNTELGGLRSRQEDLEAEVGRRLEQFELRLSNVGSNLDRADHDLATRLLLMEVDSLFAIAQNHLEISGEAGVAVQAWERAMGRLTALDGAEFESLKETARREFSRLQDYRPPDLGMQVDQLFGMADSVADWPVKTIQPGQSPADGEPEKGWRARLARVAGSLIRVESVDREFMGPGEIDLARERVRGLLQTAASALARSRPDLARGLISEAEDAVREIFETDAASVSAALARLEEITSNADRVQPPELADSRAEIARLLGEMR